LDKERADKRKEESLRMFKETHKVRNKLSKRRGRIKGGSKKRYYS